MVVGNLALCLCIRWCPVLCVGRLVRCIWWLCRGRLVLCLCIPWCPVLCAGRLVRCIWWLCRGWFVLCVYDRWCSVLGVCADRCAELGERATGGMLRYGHASIDGNRLRPFTRWRAPIGRVSAGRSRRPLRLAFSEIDRSAQYWPTFSCAVSSPPEGRSSGGEGNRNRSQGNTRALPFQAQ
jgi:hypothetical protein